MADAYRLGNLVPLSSFKSAEILLAIPRAPGASFHIVVRQAFFTTEAGKILADQLAHIHALKIAICYFKFINYGM